MWSLACTLRSLLKVEPYCENVPPALRRQPTAYGARGGRQNGWAGGPSGLTPEERQHLDALLLEHRVIRQMVDDLHRRRGVA